MPNKSVEHNPSHAKQNLIAIKTVCNRFVIVLSATNKRSLQAWWKQEGGNKIFQKRELLDWLKQIQRETRKSGCRYYVFSIVACADRILIAPILSLLPAESAAKSWTTACVPTMDFLSGSSFRLIP
jgi:hypothetical protein